MAEVLTGDRTGEQRWAAVDRTRAVAHLLDESVRIPGTDYRVGLDPILGILPVGGDLVAALASLYIVFEGIKLGAPRGTVLRMLLLVGLDLALGSIPFVGPLFDAVLKVNKWNVKTLEDHVAGV